MIRPLLTGPPPVAGAVWSADGKTTATFGNDKSVRLWNAADGKPGRVLTGHTANNVVAVTFSPDGTQLASGSADKRGVLWNLSDGIVAAEFAVHDEGAIYAVAFSGDGRYLASAGTDKTIRVWDTQSRKFLHALKGHDKHVRALAWHHDHRHLASIGDDNTIRVWDVPAGKEKLKLEDAGTKAVAWSPDGKLLFGRKIWNFDGTLADVTLPKMPTTLPLEFSWSADGERLVVGFLAHPSGFSMDVRVYNLSAAAQIQQLTVEKQTPFAWSKDGNLLTAVAADSTIELRDLTSKRGLWRGVALSEGRSATISEAGEVTLSDPAAEKELVYYVQNLDDSFETLTPAEFRKRIAGAAASKGAEKEVKK